MINENPNALPGIGTTYTAAFRTVLKTETGAMYLPGGMIIDGSQTRDITNTGYEYVIQAGMIFGRQSNGLLAPSIIGKVSTTANASATSITLTAASAVELARRIGTSGDFIAYAIDSTNGQVIQEAVRFSAVNTTTGVVTVEAIQNAIPANSLIAPNDSSRLPVCILGDGSGISVYDALNTAIDVQLAKPLIAGFVDASQLYLWPSTSDELRRFLKDLINKTCNFIFDDNFTSSGDDVDEIFPTPTDLAPTPTPTPTPAPTPTA